MNDTESKVEPRVGSFSPKIVRISKKPWQRSGDKDRRIIRRQLLEHVRLSGTLLAVEQEMQKQLERAEWCDLAEEFEWFTVYLLERMKMRGIVKWHVWQKVCFDNWKVDVGLGVDHFGELSEAYGCVFFMLNTKATEKALHRHQKRGRVGILGFRTRCPLVGALEEELRQEEDRLLAEILSFFSQEPITTTGG